MYSDTTRSGVIAVNISVDAVNAFLHDAVHTNKQHIIIYNERNEKVFASLSNSHERVHSGLDLIPDDGNDDLSVQSINGAEYFDIVRLSRHSGWSYRFLTPTDSASQLLESLWRGMVALILFAIGIGLLLTYSISRGFYRMMHRVTEIIRLAQQGEPLPPAPRTIKNEYEFLIDGVIRGFIEKEYAESELAARNYRLKYLELRILQSQINPHFLFNTLEMIHWKVIGLVGYPNEVNDILKKLGRIVSYSLSPASELVSIRDEVVYTETYLDIVHLRYPGVFRVSWSCDEHVFEYTCCRMILQPLVENTIHHSRRSEKDVVSVRIVVREALDEVILSVSDDGCGIPQQTLAEINAVLSSGNEPDQGIGLVNTDRRIRLIYGPAYGLEVWSAEGVGTTVELRIPKA